MIYRIEKLMRSARQLTSRNSFVVWLFGLAQPSDKQHRRGLLILQIDGLSYDQFNRALMSNSMPFVSRLISREHYALHSLYSGVPSSTPAIQGELFYGVRGCVPAFRFKRPEDDHSVTMLDPGVAATVEQQLVQQGGTPLLRGGSAYSNIFTGGAQESSFCASSLGWSSVVPTGNAFKMLIFSLVNIFSYLRVLGLMIIELLLAVVDSVRGVFGGRNLLKELSFVPIRVAVAVLLRELVAIGVKIDTARGLPVIHANFVGYDEQSHRRGPQSRFAHWGLRGIDNAIARIWRSAQQSQYRDYDVWIYSDHGQQATLNYPVEHGESIQAAVHRVLAANLDGPIETALSSGSHAAEDIYGNLESQNIHLLGSHKLSSWFRKIAGSQDNERLVDTEVAAMGPLGFIYVDLQIDPLVRRKIAHQLVHDARVPMVLYASQEKQQEVLVSTSEGEYSLPADKEIVLGSKHPFLDDACSDLIDLCHHAYAGEWVICGWRPGRPSLSFRIENGAHAGPGESETHAFALLPGDTRIANADREYLCYRHLRNAALSLLGNDGAANDSAISQRHQIEAVVPPGSSPERNKHSIRLMTYNIHGCVGMDGKLSVERTARVIAQYQPDVVALQELDVRDGAHQATLIAERLAMQIHFHPLQQVEKGRFGNAILTHFPLHFVKAEQLLPPASLRKKIGGAPFNEPRGALWAQIEINGITVNIITTHLGLTAKERRAQADILLSDDWLASPDCQAPIIVCGDFNAVATQPVYRRMTAVLQDVQMQLAGHTPKKTFAGRYPTVRIDHVFVDRQTEVLKVLVPRTSLSKVASDHLPLIVDLDLSAAIV